MSRASPLRYPGGKAVMSPLLRSLRQENSLGHLDFAEPFAGGAGAALTMLVYEDAGGISINDADPLIHDFWWALLNQSKRFLKLLDDTPVTMDEWYRQREINRNPRGHSRLRRGFSTFFLNRCNRSGIILKGGPIGGLEQQGTWKLDARFNKETLRGRCERIIDYHERISISGRDGIDFIQTASSEGSFLFIDPPYYRKGPMLYLNSLNHDYHRRLAAALQRRQNSPWVLTYDDCPEIRSLYDGWAQVKPFELRYSASKPGSGTEVCIAPHWMKMPTETGSKALQWKPAAA